MKLEREEIIIDVDLEREEIINVIKKLSNDDIEVEKPDKSWELSKKIVASGLQNNAFLLANEDQLLTNFDKVSTNLPTVQPYFDVSCNTCPWLLSALSKLGSNFSCQSHKEIQALLSHGIDPCKILFGNTIKISSHMKKAISSKVDLMAFDSLNELKKIAKSAPKAKLLLDLQQNGAQQKNPIELLSAAKDFGLEIVGVAVSFKGQIEKCLALIHLAFGLGKNLGFGMKIVDIGDLETILDDQDLSGLYNMSGLQIIGHLGSAFIENVFSSGAKVIGKRVGPQGNCSLVINDGIFGNFGRLLVDEDFAQDKIKPLKTKAKGQQKVSRMTCDIYGSSGDDMDILVQDYILDQSVSEGDWLHFGNMGAFSYGLESNMASTALPPYKFRIFTPVLTDNDNKLSSLDDDLNNIMDDLNREPFIIMIDLEVKTNNENDEQTCVELFEQLPDLEAATWVDNYFTNLH